MSLVGAKFICLDENGDPRAGKAVLAKGRKFAVGYYASCDYVLADARVKSVHCEIQCDAFGRVTIHNLCQEHPISVNGEVVGIKRLLLNGARISVLDRTFLWEFPKSSSSSEVANLAGAEEDASTPLKQVFVCDSPEQAPNSCPDLRVHREVPKRLTVHNFAYCIQSDEEGNSTVESPNISQNEESTQNIEEIKSGAKEIDISTADTGVKLNPCVERRSITPEPQAVPSISLLQLEVTPKMNLINCTQNKETTSTDKKKKLLTLCQQSDVVITSFSPRETGVRIEKSFTAIIKPSATPKSVYSTPKSVLSNMNDDEESMDFIDFSTPATSKKHLSRLATKNSSMHLFDFTTPNKLRPGSPYHKPALKSAAKKLGEKSGGCQKQTNFASVLEEEDEQLGVAQLPSTPIATRDGFSSDNKIPSSIGSVISLDSTDTSSIIEISADDSSPVGSTTQTLTKTPTKPAMTKPITTPMRTPQSLIKRALLASTNKQATTTPKRTVAASTTTPTQRGNKSVTGSPISPKSVSNRAALLARRQSLSTLQRKSLCVTRLKLDSSPSTSLGGPSTSHAAAAAARRSSLNPLAGRSLASSTPLGASHLRFRTATKTSPLHKVRKSVGGSPLASHISKMRKSITLPSNCSSPSKTSSLQAHAKRTNSSDTPKTRSQIATVATPSSILKDPQSSARKLIEPKKAVLFADKKPPQILETVDLSCTFTIDSDDGETSASFVDKKATVSPVKDTAEFKVELNKTFSPVRDTTQTKIELNKTFSPVKQILEVESPLDIAEIKPITGVETTETPRSSTPNSDSPLNVAEVKPIPQVDLSESDTSTPFKEDLKQDVSEKVTTPHRRQIPTIIINSPDVITESFAEIIDDSFEEAAKESGRQEPNTEETDKVPEDLLESSDLQIIEDSAVKIQEHEFKIVEDVESISDQMEQHNIEKSDKVPENILDSSELQISEDSSVKIQEHDFKIVEDVEFIGDQMEEPNTEGTDEVTEDILKSSELQIIKDSAVKIQEHEAKIVKDEESIGDQMEKPNTEKTDKVLEDILDSSELQIIEDSAVKIQENQLKIVADVKYIGDQMEESNTAETGEVLEDILESSELRIIKDSEVKNQQHELKIIEDVEYIGDQGENAALFKKIDDILNKSDEIEKQLAQTSGKCVKNTSQNLSSDNVHTEGENINIEQAKIVKIKAIEEKAADFSTDLGQTETSVPFILEITSKEAINTNPASSIPQKVFETEISTEEQITTELSLEPNQTSSIENSLLDKEKGHAVDVEETVKVSIKSTSKTSNLRGMREMLQTPKETTEPKTPCFAGVRNLLQTPKAYNSKHNETDYLDGVQSLLQTPHDSQEPTTSTTCVKQVNPTFTPLRSTRRASTSAETASANTLKRFNTRRASLSIEATISIPLTPKRIVTRRTSVDGEVSIKTPQKETTSARRITIVEENVEDMGAIVEEVSISEECDKLAVEEIMDNNQSPEDIFLTSKILDETKNARMEHEKITETGENGNITVENVSEVIKITEGENDSEDRISKEHKLAPEMESNDSEEFVVQGKSGGQIQEVADESLCEIIENSYEAASSSTKKPSQIDESIVEIIESKKKESVTEVLNKADKLISEESDENITEILDESEYDYGNVVTDTKSTNNVKPENSGKWESTTPKSRKLLKKCASTPKTPRMVGIRELLKTPGPATKTPTFVGLRDLVRTPPIVCSTPLLSGIKELMEMPTIETPISRVATETLSEIEKCMEDANKTEDECLDKFFTTPRAKNIMIPILPPSAVIEKSSTDSVELVHSIEYDLNDTNAGPSNLEDIFKTQVPSRFTERITDSINVDDTASDEGVHSTTATTSCEVAAICTPARKSITAPILQSPFSAADVISDLPKTDVQEWVDSLEDADIPNDEDVEFNAGDDEEEVTINPDLVKDNGHELSSDPLAGLALEKSLSSICLAYSCKKESQVSDGANTTIASEIMLNISTVSSLPDPLGRSVLKTVSSNIQNLSVVDENSSEIPLTLIESDMSGINLLDQTVESVFSEALIVSDSESLDKTPVESSKNIEQNVCSDNTDENTGFGPGPSHTVADNELIEALVVSDTETLNTTLEEETNDTETKQILSQTIKKEGSMGSPVEEEFPESLVVSDSDSSFEAPTMALTVVKEEPNLIVEKVETNVADKVKLQITNSNEHVDNIIKEIDDITDSSSYKKDESSGTFDTEKVETVTESTKAVSSNIMVQEIIEVCTEIKKPIVLIDPSTQENLSVEEISTQETQQKEPSSSKISNANINIQPSTDSIVSESDNVIIQLSSDDNIVSESTTKYDKDIETKTEDLKSDISELAMSSGSIKDANTQIGIKYAIETSDINEDVLAESQIKLGSNETSKTDYITSVKDTQDTVQVTTIHFEIKISENPATDNDKIITDVGNVEKPLHIQNFADVKTTIKNCNDVETAKTSSLESVELVKSKPVEETKHQKRVRQGSQSSQCATNEEDLSKESCNVKPSIETLTEEENIASIKLLQTENTDQATEVYAEEKIVTLSKNASNKELPLEPVEPTTSSGSRTRKPTERAQQFIEDVRTKVDTPSKKRTLAAENIIVDETSTETPKKLAARRGRKPSTIEPTEETERENTSRYSVQQHIEEVGAKAGTPLNKRTRAAAENSTIDEMSTATPKKMPARRGRKPSTIETTEETELKNTSSCSVQQRIEDVNAKAGTPLNKRAKAAAEDNTIDETSTATPKKMPARRGRKPSTIETTEETELKNTSSCSVQHFIEDVNAKAGTPLNKRAKAAAEDNTIDETSTATPKKMPARRGRKPSTIETTEETELKNTSSCSVQHLIEDVNAKAGTPLNKRAKAAAEDNTIDETSTATPKKMPARRGRKPSTIETIEETEREITSTKPASTELTASIDCSEGSTSTQVTPIKLRTRKGSQSSQYLTNEIDTPKRRGRKKETVSQEEMEDKKETIALLESKNSTEETKDLKQDEQESGRLRATVSESSESSLFSNVESSNRNDKSRNQNQPPETIVEEETAVDGSNETVKAIPEQQTDKNVTPVNETILEAPTTEKNADETSTEVSAEAHAEQPENMPIGESSHSEIIIQMEQQADKEMTSVNETKSEASTTIEETHNSTEVIAGEHAGKISTEVSAKTHEGVQEMAPVKENSAAEIIVEMKDDYDETIETSNALMDKQNGVYTESSTVIAKEQTTAVSESSQRYLAESEKASRRRDLVITPNAFTENIVEEESDVAESHADEKSTKVELEKVEYTETIEVALTADGETVDAETVEVVKTFKDAETVEDAKTVKDAETVDVAKTVEDSKTIEVAKTVNDVKRVNDFETVEVAKTVKDAETVEDTETVEVAKTVEDTEIVDAERVEDTKTIEDAETVDAVTVDAKTVDDVENVDAETVEVAKTVKDAETIEDTETVEVAKIIEDAEIVDSERVEDSKTIEDAETVEVAKTVEDAEIFDAETVDAVKVDAKTVDDVENVDVAETVEVAKTVEDIETVEDDVETVYDGTVEDAETVENTEMVYAETVEDTKTIEDAETVDAVTVDAKTVDDVENIDAETVEVAKTVNDAETVEDIETVENVVETVYDGTVEDAETVEVAKTVEDTEMVYAETVEDTKTIEDAETVDAVTVDAKTVDDVENVDSETVGVAKTVNDAETVEDFETVGDDVETVDSETVEDAKAVKDVETIDSETVEDSETIQDAETVKDAKTVENAETVEGTEKVVDAETVKDPETVKHAETVKDAETVEVAKTDENVETVDSETVEDAGTVQDAETDEDAKTVENAETVEGTKKVLNAETVNDPETVAITSKTTQQTKLVSELCDEPSKHLVSRNDQISPDENIVAEEIRVKETSSDITKIIKDVKVMLKDVGEIDSEEQIATTKQINLLEKVSPYSEKTSSEVVPADDRVTELLREELRSAFGNDKHIEEISAVGNILQTQHDGVEIAATSKVITEQHDEKHADIGEIIAQEPSTVQTKSVASKNYEHIEEITPAENIIQDNVEISATSKAKTEPQDEKSTETSVQTKPAEVRESSPRSLIYGKKPANIKGSHINQKITGGNIQEKNSIVCFKMVSSEATTEKDIFVGQNVSNDSQVAETSKHSIEIVGTSAENIKETDHNETIITIPRTSTTSAENRVEGDESGNNVIDTTRVITEQLSVENPIITDTPTTSADQSIILGKIQVPHWQHVEDISVEVNKIADISKSNAEHQDKKSTIESGKPVSEASQHMLQKRSRRKTTQSESSQSSLVDDEDTSKLSAKRRVKNPHDKNIIQDETDAVTEHTEEKSTKEQPETFQNVETVAMTPKTIQKNDPVEKNTDDTTTIVKEPIIEPKKQVPQKRGRRKQTVSESSQSSLPGDDEPSKRIVKRRKPNTAAEDIIQEETDVAVQDKSAEVKLEVQNAEIVVKNLPVTEHTKNVVEPTVNYIAEEQSTATAVEKPISNPTKQVSQKRGRRKATVSESSQSSLLCDEASKRLINCTNQNTTESIVEVIDINESSSDDVPETIKENTEQVKLKDVGEINAEEQTTTPKQTNISEKVLSGQNAEETSLEVVLDDGRVAEPLTEESIFASVNDGHIKEIASGENIAQMQTDGVKIDPTSKVNTELHREKSADIGEIIAEEPSTTIQTKPVKTERESVASPRKKSRRKPTVSESSQSSLVDGEEALRRKNRNAFTENIVQKKSDVVTEHQFDGKSAKVEPKTVENAETVEITKIVDTERVEDAETVDDAETPTTTQQTDEYVTKQYTEERSTTVVKEPITDSTKKVPQKRGRRKKIEPESSQSSSITHEPSKLAVRRRNPKTSADPKEPTDVDEVTGVIGQQAVAEQHAEESSTAVTTDDSPKTKPEGTTDQESKPSIHEEEKQPETNVNETKTAPKRRVGRRKKDEHIEDPVTAIPDVVTVVEPTKESAVALKLEEADGVTKPTTTRRGRQKTKDEPKETVIVAKRRAGGRGKIAHEVQQEDVATKDEVKSEQEPEELASTSVASNESKDLTKLETGEIQIKRKATAAKRAGGRKKKVERDNEDHPDEDIKANTAEAHKDESEKTEEILPQKTADPKQLPQTESPKRNRTTPRRLSAAHVHNYCESSDTEIASTKSTRKPAVSTDSATSPAKSARKPVVNADSANISPTKSSRKPAANTDSATSRGRKPTARMQQFLEEERARAVTTPSKRRLLSVAEAEGPSAIETPTAATPKKNPTRRGRIPSTKASDVTVNVVESSPEIITAKAPPQRATRDRSASVVMDIDAERPPTNSSAKTDEDTHSSHAEDLEVLVPAKGRKRVARKAGKQAVSAADDKEEQEPLCKKSPILLAAEKDAAATKDETETPRRGGRRVLKAVPSTAAATSFNVEDATPIAAEPTRRGARRGVAKTTSYVEETAAADVQTAVLVEEEKPKSSTTRGGRVKSKAQPPTSAQKRSEQRINSALTVDAPPANETSAKKVPAAVVVLDDEEDEDAPLAQVAAAKRNAPKGSTDSPATKRTRRKAVEKLPLPPVESRRGLNVRFEATPIAASTATTAEATAAATSSASTDKPEGEVVFVAEIAAVDAVAAAPPAKRATRSRRK